MPSSKRQKRGKLNNPGIKNSVESSPIAQSDIAISKNAHGKKDRRLKKRQDFLSKLQADRDAIKEKKAAKKRSEAPVVGDLNPMTLALAELDAAMKSVEEDKPVTAAIKPDTNNNDKPGKLKRKRLQKQILNDILMMKSALGSSSISNLEEPN